MVRFSVHISYLGISARDRVQFQLQTVEWLSCLQGIGIQWSRSARFYSQHLLHSFCFYVDFVTYLIYYLEQDYIPLYPLSIVCSSGSRSFSLTECSSAYDDSEYTATTINRVGIRCKTEG